VRSPDYGNRALLSERSGERALQKNDGAERSGGSRSGNGAGSRGYKIRLERGAAFSPAPLRSHALNAIRVIGNR